ncbi:Hypothetical Protein FCC1311_020772 [Hondaea fermentalgiana]|uniref:Uncharacterized protein n=1 Tax=Hondaea fermentalgiana TaxID=2315210 RepID=A0A2R5G7T2_9STRA|nr:Hypothetical Protein FCC1311_020772 [Hondaea fermentalgiana]|eukprot:GBG25858.1 Hypothetical Protein FCC1311_020772 [Hondaea fermentalgiana]
MSVPFTTVTALREVAGALRGISANVQSMNEMLEETLTAAEKETTTLAATLEAFEDADLAPATHPGPRAPHASEVDAAKRQRQR